MEQRVHFIVVAWAILAIALFVTATTLAVESAHGLVNWLRNTPEPIPGIKLEWVTGSVTLLALTGYVKEIVQFIVDLPNQLKPQGVSKALNNTLKIFFLTFSMMVTYLSFANRAPTITLLPAYPVYIRDNESAPLAILPVFYRDNAGRDANGEWDRGVEIESDAVLQELIRLLERKCAVSPLAEGVFEFRVAGSASSKEFVGSTDEESRDLNVTVTNERTRRAVRVLERLVDGKPEFKISFQPDLTTYDELVQRRPYIDLVGTSSLPREEELNRRADIQIVKAGSCTKQKELLEKLTTP